MTEDLTDQVAHDTWSTYVDSFSAIRLVDGGSYELKVNWLGLDDSTWEPLETMHGDVPEKVIAYLTRIARGNGRVRDALAKLQKAV